MSAVAWAELLCGPLARSEMEWAAEIVGQRQDFTAEHAALAARLFNESGRRRGSLIDCMIAGHGAGRRRVPRDREYRGLSPVQGLRLDDGIKPLPPGPHFDQRPASTGSSAIRQTGWPDTLSGRQS